MLAAYAQGQEAMSGPSEVPYYLDRFRRNPPAAPMDQTRGGPFTPQEADAGLKFATDEFNAGMARMEASRPQSSARPRGAKKLFDTEGFLDKINPVRRAKSGMQAGVKRAQQEDDILSGRVPLPKDWNRTNKPNPWTVAVMDGRNRVEAERREQYYKDNPQVVRGYQTESQRQARGVAERSLGGGPMTQRKNFDTLDESNPRHKEYMARKFKEAGVKNPSSMSEDDYKSALDAKAEKYNERRKKRRKRVADSVSYQSKLRASEYNKNRGQHGFVPKAPKRFSFSR
jgi:hypothetical protein